MKQVIHSNFIAAVNHFCHFVRCRTRKNLEHFERRTRTRSSIFADHWSLISIHKYECLCFDTTRLIWQLIGGQLPNSHSPSIFLRIYGQQGTIYPIFDIFDLYILRLSVNRHVINTTKFCCANVHKFSVTFTWKQHWTLNFRYYKRSTNLDTTTKKPSLIALTENYSRNAFWQSTWKERPKQCWSARKSWQSHWITKRVIRRFESVFRPRSNSSPWKWTAITRKLWSNFPGIQNTFDAKHRTTIGESTELVQSVQFSSSCSLNWFALHSLITLLNLC